MSAELIRALEACRAAEREQALYYRALAAAAEEAQRLELAERFHGLHADEQHHVSRLTARVLELGGNPSDLPATRVEHPPLDGWEEPTRRREREEVARYRALLEQPLDAETEALVRVVLEVEQRHAEELGGKWTMA